MEKMNNVLQYTGSRYDGEIKSERMEGKGTYSFASGTRYEGELLDGRFHGAGVLHMTSGASIEGVWIKGKLIERKLTFSDGLKFDESDEWEYCQPNDRRFYTEICNGLKPAGRSQLTNEPRDVKKDHYDTGDGYYHPEKRVVYTYDGAFKRNADQAEHEWIVAHCRKAWDEFVGLKKA